MKVTIVTDANGWMEDELRNWVSTSDINADLYFCNDYDHVEKGDVAFFLGCTRIASKSVLRKNTYNLVVHESDLPLGRGFAPITWQILNGANRVRVCLIAAAAEADSGEIFDSEWIEFSGDELCQEIRSMQFDTTIRLICRFIEDFPKVNSEPQVGEATYFRRRTPEDSELDTSLSLSDQFDVLRVVDNDRYPAFFYMNGKRYVVKIESNE